MSDSIRLLMVLAVCLAGCRPPEARHAAARTEYVLVRLGEEIQRRVPGGKVLVVGNPFVRKRDVDRSTRQAEEDAIRGLKRGLGGEGSFAGVATPELKPGALENPGGFPIPPGATTPLSFLSTPEAWDRLRDEHPAANVWVSLIGVPADLEAIRAWTDPAGPRWAFYLPDLRLVGSGDTLRNAFQSGRLLAVVVRRPGAPAESEVDSGDAAKDFERRYLLITGENFDAMRGAWPQLLP